jgi:hypothetical protein
MELQSQHIFLPSNKNGLYSALSNSLTKISESHTLPAERFFIDY